MVLHRPQYLEARDSQRLNLSGTEATAGQHISRWGSAVKPMRAPEVRTQTAKRESGRPGGERGRPTTISTRVSAIRFPLTKAEMPRSPRGMRTAAHTSGTEYAPCRRASPLFGKPPIPVEGTKKPVALGLVLNR
jgi:hypothetical protein